MFQFTREFIINDNIGKLKGGVKFKTVGETMFVDNMVNIRKEDVHSVYKHEFEPEVKEKVVIKGAGLTAPAATDLVRLVVTLGQRGKVTATYNDVYPDHSRHFFYETTGAATVADMFNGLLDSYKHEETLARNEFYKLSVSGNDLVIDVPDCYTIVKEVRLVKLPTANPQQKIGELLTGYEEWDVILKWVRKNGTTTDVTFTAGEEGNGNTVQILKNMRLQTSAHLNPHGLQMDERPLPKGEYDQYTVELVTERHHIGHDVMGSVGTSLTTLVFYVLRSATCDANNISAEFEQALTDLCEQAPKPAKGAAAKRVLAHTSDLPEKEEPESSASAE